MVFLLNFRKNMIKDRSLTLTRAMLGVYIKNI